MNAIVLHAEPAMFSESNKRDPELQQALSEFEKTGNGLTPKPVFSRPYDTIPGIYDKEDPKVIERRKAFIEKMGKNWVLHPEYEQLIRSGRLPENPDPVLLNNSILPYWWRQGLSVGEIDRFKKRLRAGKV